MLTTTAAAFAFTASPSTRPSVGRVPRRTRRCAASWATLNSKLSSESLRLKRSHGGTALRYVSYVRPLRVQT